MKFDRSAASACIERLDQMAKPNKWGQSVELSKDTLERISLLLGISKGLQSIAPLERDDLCYIWFNQPNMNPLFKGQSIKDFLMREKTIESFYDVRNYLMAHCAP